MQNIRNAPKKLNQDDLLQALLLSHECMRCVDSERFHEHILQFASYLGFEFVLYGFMHTTYNHREQAHVVNLSKPEAWVDEYRREHLRHDPVLQETELRINAGERDGVFVWDRYAWPLSPLQEKIIERRRAFGLEYGCSAFANSRRKDFAFLISFASESRAPDARVEAMVAFVVQHLMLATKRLFILELLNSLTRQETQVADALLSGRNNTDIAKHLRVTNNTVKFHLGNIYRKLQVDNRQQAIALLIAERHLSV